MTFTRFISLLFCLLVTPALFAQTSPEMDALDQAHDLYQQKKYKDCLKLLKETVKRYPNCSECYVALGSFHTHFGDFGEATDAADHAVNVAGTDLLRAQAHLYRCQLLVGSSNKKDLAKAEQDCRETLRLAPKTAEAHLNLGVALLRENHDDEGLAEIKSYVEGWPQANNVTYAKKILTNPRAAREAVAPDFAVTCEDGKKIASSDLAGKVVVIDFWATWCPACRAALPDLKDLVRKYPSDRLVIISASADSDRNAWRDYITRKEMTWPQVLDIDQNLITTFDVHAFPTYIVIDSDGIIRKRIVGTNPQQSLAYQLKAELKTVFENSVH